MVSQIAYIYGWQKFHYKRCIKALSKNTKLHKYTPSLSLSLIIHKTRKRLSLLFLPHTLLESWLGLGNLSHTAHVNKSPPWHISHWLLFLVSSPIIWEKNILISPNICHKIPNKDHHKFKNFIYLKSNAKVAPTSTFNWILALSHVSITYTWKC